MIAESGVLLVPVWVPRRQLQAMSVLQQCLVAVLCLVAVAGGQGQPECKYSWYIPPNGRSYTIRSPGYPSSFKPGSSCYWYLYTDQGTQLNLNCFSVNIEKVAGWSCVDSIGVYGSNLDSNYCSPFNLNSTNHKILLSLQSSYMSRGGTFSCSVQMITPKKDCDCGWSFKTKVVGGDEAGINEFPSMASLVDANKRAHVCGASIISPRYVLTAAHCIDELKVPTTGVLVGDHDLSTGSETTASKLYRAKRFVVHPEWSRKRVKNDIGLVEVVQAMQFNARVGPVCLPWYKPNVPEVGEYLIVLGWGTTSFGGPVSEVLMKAGTRVVAMENCQRSFSSLMPLHKEQVCTFETGKDSCQFDSGGPLLSPNPQLSRYFLASIVSYGAQCAGDDPSVSTKVYNYLDWISSATGGGEDFCIKQ